MCEARKAFYKPKTTSKAIWIEKSNSTSCEAGEKSLDSASCEANLALRKAQPLLSHEAKAKAPLCADNEANIISLPLPVHSANVPNREVNNETPLGANSEATPTLLSDRALPCSAMFASTGITKAIASLREANSLGEAILTSPTAKKLASKAKPEAFQPKKANIQLP